MTTNILVADIETSLMEVYTHYIGSKVSVHPSQIKTHSRIICISYKWLGDRKAKSLTWDNKTHDDTEMLLKFNDIASKASAIIFHNGLSFDIKEIRGALALRGVPISWCETPVIDTLRDYRRSFRFKSNRLDAIAAHLGLARKNPMSMQDWIDVNNNAPGALRKMVKYCEQDVDVLEQVYQRLEMYVKHTASTLQTARSSAKLNHNITCTECGSEDVIKHGFYTYKGAHMQRYLCKSCYKVLRPEVIS